MLNRKSLFHGYFPVIDSVGSVVFATNQHRFSSGIFPRADSNSLSLGLFLVIDSVGSGQLITFAFNNRGQLIDPSATFVSI